MHRVILSAAIVLLLSGPLRAQSTLSAEQKTQLKAWQEANLAELNLTEEQKPKVEAIQQTYRQGLADLKNSNGSRLAKYRTYNDLKERRNQQMSEVLTREQYKTYRQQQEEQEKELKKRRSSRN
ncbi:hypothetical protein GCM10028803_41630 [Larkinella knui]|uniref:DUF4890 domain-containing protein n=1 Tax=Larkinella knui TaxID=2025310 RepID=A0A3P1CPB4_9BACT|nr:hypothetical protein [Larkinella knui]RRB14794.1 hypothetical protein EHT87_09495 [Larkinella knui]